MKRCRVSVCVPTYNYGRYLPAALESVQNQGFRDFELIVIDDASQDDTREVIGKYVRSDPRIRFRVNPENLGMVRNWNECLRLARGEYVKFLFADDLLSSPDALEKMVSLLDSRPDVSLAGSARNLVDPEGIRLSVTFHFRGGAVVNGSDVIDRCLRERKNLIGEPSAVMFRRRDAMRGFDERYKHLVDLEMWFHLLEMGAFGFIDAPLVSFRVHPGQQTVQNIDQRADIEDAFLLFEEYLGKPYLRMGRLTRRFLFFDELYKIWKLYRRKKLDRTETEREIGEHMAFRTFLYWLPFYKAYKPLFKLDVRIRRWNSGAA
jgi:glycosyltransferase involved in cell wall biosynthesis